MCCKWPFCRDKEGINGFPVRLRSKIGSKPKIAEFQSAKKGAHVSSRGFSTAVFSTTMI